MLTAAIENFVLFSTVFAVAGFVIVLALRHVIAIGLWALRADTIARFYTSAIVTPPLAALWLIAAAFLPQLWLTNETFEAAHSAPYHQVHLLGELTLTLEPTLSYALFTFVIVTGIFAIWSNIVGTWRIGKVIGRLEMNAAAPPTDKVALVNEIAAQRGFAVGLVMTDYPLSFVWGVRRSKLIVSSGLLRTLNPQELAGVLEHESAHHRRRDNLFKLLLSLCTFTSLAFPLSRLILRWRATEVEAICDEEAVACTSAPLDLAEALVKLRRQTSTVKVVEPTATSALVSGFVSGNAITFEYRVNRLLNLSDSTCEFAKVQKQNRRKRINGLLIASATLTLLGIFLFAPLSIHHAAEALIQILK